MAPIQIVEVLKAFIEVKACAHVIYDNRSYNSLHDDSYCRWGKCPRLHSVMLAHVQV